MPPREQLLADLRRFLMRELGGWVQLVAVELLLDGSVEWIEDAVVPGGLRLDEWRTLAVRCEDRPGPRRPGLWTALAVAFGLAERLGGQLVDPRRGSLGPGIGRLRPPADGRVHAVDHLCVPSSRGSDQRRWLTSVGMTQFGLPELELLHVPRRVVELGARLLVGVAQHLIDGARLPSAQGHPRELLVTSGELSWALRRDGVPTRGRGWTRVGVELDGGRGWPLRLRIGPPLGARSWRDNGKWLEDAWAELFGPPQA